VVLTQWKPVAKAPLAAAAPLHGVLVDIFGVSVEVSCVTVNGRRQQWQVKTISSARVKLIDEAIHVGEKSQLGNWLEPGRFGGDPLSTVWCCQKERDLWVNLTVQGKRFVF
jgi:hypothetical protein